MLRRVLITIVLSCISIVSLAEPLKYEGYDPVMLCNADPYHKYIVIGTICLFSNCGEIQYYYRPNNDYFNYRWGTIMEIDAEQYGFKTYHQILKMLQELKKNEPNRTLSEKRDNPLVMIKLPEEYVSDFFDYITKKEPQFFAELQKIKNTTAKNMKIVNDILDGIVNETLSQSLVIAELNGKVEEFKLISNQQKHVLDLYLIKVQKNVSELLIDNYKKISYMAKVNNNYPKYNSLRSIIKFATKIESKLNISMNEALEMAIGLNDGLVFSNIKFPGTIKRELIVGKLKNLAQQKNYHENIETIMDCVESLYTKGSNNYTDDLIQQTIKHFEKAKKAQEAHFVNLQSANRIIKLLELLRQSSSQNINDDAITMVNFTEEYFKYLVRTYECALYFKDPSAQYAYLRRYAKIRTNILLDYIKEYDINNLDDLSAADTTTKETFAKEIKYFDWKNVASNEFDDQLTALRATNKIKNLTRNIDFFNDDPSRIFEKDTLFKYRGPFNFIDKWFDQYYND